MPTQLQQRAVAFAQDHDLDAPPSYRVLDLVAEVGEVAADVTKSSNYGAELDELEINEDELGDALFSLLLVADTVDVDAEAALETSLEKYERRFEESGDVGSGV